MRLFKSGLVKDGAGSALLEFSLVLPLLIFTFMGLVDYSLYYQRAMLITDAAANAARYGSIVGNGTNYSGMVAVAQSGAAGLSGFSAVATRYCTTVPGGAQVGCTASVPGTNPLEYVQVTASAAVPPVFSVAGLPGNKTMSSTATMQTAWQGQ
jgi:Flp pilus assembly protein TadG